MASGFPVLVHQSGYFSAEGIVYREANVFAFGQAVTQIRGERGDMEECERMYREVLAMRQTLFGDSHPDVARSLRDLARFLLASGRAAEAEPLYGLPECGVMGEYEEG